MSNITVIMPTSPIEAHPTTKYLDETIATIRHHLPDSEIILTIDGVREEQEKFRDRYTKYTHKVLWKCLHDYKSVLPLVFDEHKHQSGMLKEALKEVNTDLIMYVEHDAPLTPDRKIDFKEITDFIYSGEAYTVRLHHENVIPDEHKPLILKTKGNFKQTYQWSQRPHISTKIYYKWLASHFKDEWRTMIEDYWHGAVHNDFRDEGMLGWYKHRLWIYHPEGGIQRSYHLDTRGSEPKFDMLMD